MAEENKINLNLDFESIVPWNGQQDTGRDVRLKLDRNWRKVVDAFNFLLGGGYLDSLYLRKDQDDRSVGTIASDKGFEAGNFNVGATGAACYQDKDGNWHIETDHLKVRKKASFTEVEIETTYHVGGQQISTGASMVVDYVLEMDSCYRCYFLKKDNNGRVTTNKWKPKDQAYCNTFNLVKQEDGTLGNHYLWRLVESTSNETADDVDVRTFGDVTINTTDYHFTDLSKTVFAEGSDIPKAMDEIVLLGHQGNDESRQGCIIVAGAGEGSPYIYEFTGINSFELPEPETKVKPGDNKFTGRMRIEGGSTGAANLVDLNIGAINLLLNSGFNGDYRAEDLSEDYQLKNGSELFSKSLKHWTGKATVNNDDTAVSGKCVHIGSLSQSVQLIKDEVYVVSFKARGASVKIMLGGDSFEYDLTSEYEKYSMKFTSDGICTFSISGDATICDLQLERGIIATDWKPSPYDNDKTLAEFQALKYLQDAIVEGDTTILGGLILSSIIKLGNFKDGKMQKVNAGVSGIYTDDDDVAFWGGGTFEEAIKTVMKFRENPNCQPKPEDWSNLAKFVVTHGGDLFLRGTIFAENGYFRGRLEQGNGATILERDGSGHLANGAISWNPYGVMYRRAYDVIVWRKITDSPSVIDLNLGTYLDLTGDGSTYTLPNATFDGTPLYLRWEQISRSSYCAILQGSFKAKAKSDGEITYQSANKLTLDVEDKDIQLKYSTEESAWIYEGAGVIINENGLMIIDRVVESETEIMADKVTSNSFAVGDRLGITQTIPVYENGGRSYFTFTGGILTAYKYESNEE